MALTHLITLFSVSVILYVAHYLSTRKPRRFPLPPGPKHLPILGNILDFPPPKTAEFQHWLKHKSLYGPISSVSVLGTTLILIHDRQIARDLLDAHSGRPEMVFAGQMCGFEEVILCQGYTERFKRERKLLNSALAKGEVAKYLNVTEDEVKRQLIRGLNEPERWLEGLKTTAAATILKVTYNYPISRDPTKTDALVSLIDRTMHEFSLASVPMGWIVDMLPILQHIPFLPSSLTAAAYKKNLTSTANTPYAFTVNQISSTPSHINHSPSYVSTLLSKTHLPFHPTPSEQNSIKWTAASLYGAATDTTFISLSAFTLAMTRFPLIQQKAQTEIDLLIPLGSRLPTFSDREKLPYTTALLKEVLRWWPVAPMGFPHTAEKDTTYEGYHIPKGAVLLPNVWSFLHDSETYANPEEFEPERFLEPRNEPDPSANGAWGYGRRICAGRHFAEENLWVNIVGTLAVFVVEGKGDGGEGGLRPGEGMLCKVPGFEVRVRPRSEECVELLRRIGVELGDEV